MRERQLEQLRKDGGDQLASYFQASLSLEIIYTVLNAVTQQFNNSRKSVTLKKKQSQIMKIKNLEKTNKSLSDAYKNLDYYDEVISRMESQKMSNLQELRDSEILLTGQKTTKSVVDEGDVQESLELILNRKVIVKQYAPQTFENIRQLHNIKVNDLTESLEPSKNIKQIQNAGEGAGASGSFFFFAADRRFIMKTMSQKEINHLLRVLPHYYEHVDTYPECTIAKIFGIYSVTIDSFEPVHVMIMQNSMPNVPETELQYVFDMKGSSINRAELKKETD